MVDVSKAMRCMYFGKLRGSYDVGEVELEFGEAVMELLQGPRSSVNLTRFLPYFILALGAYQPIRDFFKFQTPEKGTLANTS